MPAGLIFKDMLFLHVTDLALQIFSQTASLSHALLVAVWRRTTLTASSLTRGLLVRVQGAVGACFIKKSTQRIFWRPLWSKKSSTVDSRQNSQLNVLVLFYLTGIPGVNLYVPRRLKLENNVLEFDINKYKLRLQSKMMVEFGQDHQVRS